MESTAVILPATSQSGAFIAKLGAWMQVAQLFGLLGTVFAMMKAFDVLRTSGAGDPERLSVATGEMLMFVSAGLALSFVGFVLVIIAITAYRYRSGWMWHFLCIHGLLIIAINVGLVVTGHFAVNIYLPVGLFFLIFALVKKDEFVRATPRRPLPACYKLDE